MSQRRLYKRSGISASVISQMIICEICEKGDLDR